MKATKRFLSAIMAMTMVCGTVVSVSAADEENVQPISGGGGGYFGEMNGTGSNEGSVSMEKFRIVLPTTEINYIVDAQGLIKQSTANGSKRITDKNTTVVYSTKEAFVNGTKEITDAKALTVTNTDPKKCNYVKQDGFVFFSTTTGGKTKMSNYFDITIENKSSYDVDICPVLTYAQFGSSPIEGTEYSSTPAEKGLAFNLFEKKAVMNGNKATGQYSYTPLNDESKIKVGNAEAAYVTQYTAGADGAAGTYDYAYNETKYKAAKDLDNIRYFTLEGLAATDIEAKDPGKLKIVWTFKKAETATGNTDSGDDGDDGDDGNG